VLVEHAVMPFRLAAIAVDGVGQVLRRRALEMDRLSRERSPRRREQLSV
jgi:hypothetical protein